MQKKVVGILAGVATAHAVLFVSMVAGGGCRQPEILGPHTYNDGPEFNEVPPAAAAPAVPGNAPRVAEDAPIAPPPAVAPVEVNNWNVPEEKPAPVAVKEPVKAGSLTYKVKRGDSLSLIAYKHGVSVRELAACNNLSGKAMNLIRVGQVLTIPEGGVYNPDRPVKKRAPKNSAAPKTSGSAVKAELPADGVYVVKSGDSLDRIGRRYGVTAKAIAKENNIALNKILQIGDKLRIPGKAAANTAPAVAEVKGPELVAPAVPKIDSNDPLADLDPNLGLDNTAAPAETTAASNGAAADAVSAVSADGAAAATEATDSMEIPNDMSIEEYSKMIGTSVEDIRRLNPHLPADGKLRGGSYVVIPRL